MHEARSTYIVVDCRELDLKKIHENKFYFVVFFKTHVGSYLFLQLNKKIPTHIRTHFSCTG